MYCFSSCHLDAMCLIVKSLGDTCHVFHPEVTYMYVMCPIWVSHGYLPCVSPRGHACHVPHLCHFTWPPCVSHLSTFTWPPCVSHLSTFTWPPYVSHLSTFTWPPYVSSVDSLTFPTSSSLERVQSGTADTANTHHSQVTCNNYTPQRVQSGTADTESTHTVTFNDNTPQYLTANTHHSHPQ